MLNKRLVEDMNLLEAQGHAINRVDLFLNQIFVGFGRSQLIFKQNERYGFMRYSSPPFDLIFSSIYTHYIQTKKRTDSSL